MNPETNNQPNESFLTPPTPKTPHPVNQVTAVSKYLALALFIFLPFIGGYVGYVYAPEKVEIDMPLVTTVLPENNIIDANSSTTTEMPVATKGSGLLLSTKIISDPVTVGLKPEIGKTEIFIGTAESPQELSLGIFDGSCSVQSVDEDILNYRSVLKPAIQNVDQIISRVYCGWSDDGSETVLYKKTEVPISYEVLHVELTGCEGRPCMAMDTVSVLKTISTAAPALVVAIDKENVTLDYDLQQETFRLASDVILVSDRGEIMSFEEFIIPERLNVSTTSPGIGRYGVWYEVIFNERNEVAELRGIFSP